MRVDPHWRLFEDWCTATGNPAMPTTVDVIVRFLTDCPCTRDVMRARVRAIVYVHHRNGYSLRVPLAPRVDRKAFRSGPHPEEATRADGSVPDWLSLTEAIASLPIYGYPHALAGRRDGVVLVAAGWSGLSAPQIAGLTPADVTATDDTLTLAGHVIPVGRDGTVCPRCALTRWLRVLDAWARQREWYNRATDVEEAVQVRLRPGTHDCYQPVSPRWKESGVLIPVLESGQLPAFTLHPLSTRAIREVIDRRQAPGALTAPDLVLSRNAEAGAREMIAAHTPAPTGQPLPVVEHTGAKLTKKDHDEISGLFDRFEEESDAVAARAEALLASQGISTGKKKRRA